jgi:hypothetical protein
MAKISGAEATGASLRIRPVRWPNCAVFAIHQQIISETHRRPICAGALARQHPFHGEGSMKTHVIHGAHGRLKVLVVRLGLALGLGTGLAAVPFSAQPSDHSTPWRPFANKAPARPGGGASVPVTNCNDDGAGSLRDAVEATPRPAR